MMALPSISFKDGQTASEFDQIDSRLIAILNDMGRVCDLSGFKLVVSDLLSSSFDDARLGRVSTTHADGRAADISLKGWTEEFIKKFMVTFENRYGHLGAYSKSDGAQRLLVRHNHRDPSGKLLGDHLHVQVKRGK